LKANDLEIGQPQRAIESLQAEIGNYQARLNNTPIREQELTDLNRDYEQLKAYYDQLLAKKNQAGLAANFSREQQGDRFYHAGPAQQTDQAIFAQSLQTGLSGIIRWSGNGAGCSRGAEFLDDRVYDEAVFKQMLPAEF